MMLEGLALCLDRSREVAGQVAGIGPVIEQLTEHLRRSLRSEGYRARVLLAGFTMRTQRGRSAGRLRGEAEDGAGVVRCVCMVSEPGGVR